MNIENPEIRARVLEWQKRNNIEDGDPALALLELINIFQLDRPAQQVNVQADPANYEQISEALKTSLLPAIDRLTFQSQELQKKLETINFEQFAKQIESYHEGIDYCTKKLDVVKKESDSLIIKIEKASASIKPITTGAVLMLMAVCGVLGFILSTILR